MITVKLVGGLANQMNQYALGISLALQNDDELFLDTDPFFYDIREYELGIFNIHAQIAQQKHRPRYLILRRNKLLDTLRYPVIRICKKINPHHILENPKHPKIYSGMYDFHPEVMQRVINTKGKKYYIEGFRHSEKYYNDYEEVIREHFTLKQGLDAKNMQIIKKIQETNSVSIHVRRGDYAGTHYAGICGPDYYRRAIQYIQKHCKAPCFFVLSDDIGRCKQTFKDYPIQEYIENGGNRREKNAKQIGTEKHGADAYKNMILISQCKHNIIANSSFSRRGARLNNNPNKIVVAPNKRHQNIDYADIIPSERIRL